MMSLLNRPEKIVPRGQICYWETGLVGRVEARPSYVRFSRGGSQSRRQTAVSYYSIFAEFGVGGRSVKGSNSGVSYVAYFLI